MDGPMEIVAIPGNGRPYNKWPKITWVTGVIAQVNFTPFLTINRDLVGFVYEDNMNLRNIMSKKGQGRR